MCAPRRRTRAGEIEATVIAALQERLSALTRPQPQKGVRGKKPALANWKGLVAELRAECPQNEEDQEEQESAE